MLSLSLSEAVKEIVDPDFKSLKAAICRNERIGEGAGHRGNYGGIALLPSPRKSYSAFTVQFGKNAYSTPAPASHWVFDFDSARLSARAIMRAKALQRNDRIIWSCNGFIR
jgi:hypothetical protein